MEFLAAPAERAVGMDEARDGVLWRARVQVYGDGRATVRYDKWTVIDTTPEGVWLRGEYGHGKTWRTRQTRFASKTKREALAHLIARKRSHVKHSRRRLRDAELALRESEAHAFKHSGHERGGR